MKKNIFIYFFALSLFLFFFFKANFVFANGAERPLEINYPELPKIETPTSTATPLPNYLAYLYYFFLFVGGILGLGAVVYSGFRYLTSIGKPEAIKDAKEQILAALIGLLILFAAVLVLNQISPDFKRFYLKPTIPPIPSFPSGVLLCKDYVEVREKWESLKKSKNLYKELENASENREKEIIEQLKNIKKEIDEVLNNINEKCVQITGSGDIPDPLNDKGKWVFLIPSGFTTSSAQYGVILYEKTKFEGEVLIFYNWEDPPRPFAFNRVAQKSKTIEDLKPSSAKPFILEFNPQPRPIWDVVLYELIDFNKADPKKATTAPTLPTIGYPARYTELKKDQKIDSLKIEGNLIVIFFKESASQDNSYQHWEKEIDVFTETDSSLEDNKMGKWCGPPLFKYSCASAVVVVSGKVF